MNRMLRRIALVVRIVAAVTAIARIAQAARRRPPLAAAVTRPGWQGEERISVVVPARDEARRIGPLLDAIVGAPGVLEVLVVDDESTDDTAAIAIAAGATVVPGTALPHGWAGKAWAIQQGVQRAKGDWVVTLDSDTRPSPDLPLALVERAEADGLQFVTVGGRFECPTPGAQWLHPAMLTTLVYRFGPAGRAGHVAPHRQLANGQCMAFPRQAFLHADGMLPVAAEVVEDVALARHLAGRGWPVAMLDGPDLLTTRMYESLGETFTGWGRSLALPGVEPAWRQAVDLVVVLAAQALPLPRLLLRKGDALDVVLLLVRLGTLAGTAQAYERPRAPYWLSPLADLPAVGALAAGAVRRRQTWRGRSYG
jgi:dolichol-phosphate mannosyltransferase